MEKSKWVFTRDYEEYPARIKDGKDPKSEVEIFLNGEWVKMAGNFTDLVRNIFPNE